MKLPFSGISKLVVYFQKKLEEISFGIWGGLPVETIRPWGENLWDGPCVEKLIDGKIWTKIVRQDSGPDKFSILLKDTDYSSSVINAALVRFFL